MPAVGAGAPGPFSDGSGVWEESDDPRVFTGTPAELGSGGASVDRLCVRVAEAAHARLWGEDGNGLFPAAKKPRDAEEEDAAEGAARRRETRTEDSDEDEMDALLRDLPGGIGA